MRASRALLLCVAALTLLAAPAAAAQVDVQAVNDRTTAWLRATLHAQVDDRAVLVTDEVSAGEYPGDDTVRLHPGLIPGLARPTPSGSSLAGDPASAVALVHEALHRRETEACWWANEDREHGVYGDEEGIVRALTIDLIPSWARRFGAWPGPARVQLPARRRPGARVLVLRVRVEELARA